MTEDTMHARTGTIIPAALCSLLAASACKPKEGARSTIDTVKPAEPAPAATPTATGEVGPLATAEKQWQILLDSVRADVGRDSAAAARKLHSAATAVRREANEASEATRTALTRSADELDSLGASIERGTKRTAQSVDSAFARLEQAETLNRLAKATDAWAKQQRERAGEELQAAADSYERAATGAKAKLDTGATTVLAGVRDINERLKKAANVTDDEFRKTTAELEKRARSLGDRIAARSSAAPKS
jgi:hypothetical protein